jgi:hypothetical protein
LVLPWAVDWPAACWQITTAVALRDWYTTAAHPLASGSV